MFREEARKSALAAANSEDAELWRWFSAIFDEGRIRWCRSHRGWLVSVDHRHVATDEDFDSAIRNAKARCSV